MIKIINTKPEMPEKLSTYEVYINNELITTFQHKRIDGLAKCLIVAGKAVEKAQWEKAYNMPKKSAERKG